MTAVVVVAMSCHSNVEAPPINKLAQDLVPGLDFERSAVELAHLSADRTFYEYTGWSFRLLTNSYGVSDVLLKFDVGEREPDGDDVVVEAELFFPYSDSTRSDVLNKVVEVLGEPSWEGCTRPFGDTPVQLLAWGDNSQDYAMLAFPQATSVGVHKVVNFPLRFFPQGRNLRAALPNLELGAC